MLRRIALAQAINRQCGGTVVRPWDDELFDELETTGWLDAFRALHGGLPRMRDGLKRIEAAKANILARHPTYGK